MTKINSTLLNHFHNHGLYVNQGVAIDTRLIKYTSRPISIYKTCELIDKRDHPEVKLYNNGIVKEFSRDLEPEWIVKNDNTIMALKTCKR